MDNKKYFVFISYSSKDNEDDNKWAEWLRHELDHWHLPTTYHGRKPVQENLREVFRDRDGFCAGKEWDKQVEPILKESQNLIVICSPNAAKSEAVNKEVEFFINQGKEYSIFPFIVEGDCPAECFPRALKHSIVGGDVNKDGGRDAAFIKVVAGMLGVDFSDLYNRYELDKAEQERIEREKKEKLQISQSRFLAEKANSLVVEGDSYTASLLALEALPQIEDKDPRPYVPSAEFALRNAVRKEQAVLRGHGNWVSTIAISNDDKWIISGSHDNTIRVWERASGACRYVLDGYVGVISSVQVSSDCKYIVSGGDKTIKIWSLETGHFVRDLAKYNAFISGVAISPDNTYVYSALQNGVIEKLDFSTGETLLKFEGHAKHITSMSLSHDGQLIVSTAGDNTVKIWDAFSGEIIQDIKVASPDQACFNSNDTRVIVSASYGKVIIYDVYSGEQTQLISVAGKNSFIEALIFSPTDKYVLTGELDNSVSGEIKIWDTQNGELIQTLKGHTSAVDALVFSNDGKYLISGSKDKTLRIWEFNVSDRQKQTKRRLFFTPPTVVSKAVFTSGGDIIASYWDNTLKLWDSGLTYCKIKLEGHTSHVTSFSMSSDEELLASVSSDKTIRVWNIITGKEEKRIWDPARELQSVAFSPDGRLLIASCDNDIKMWNTQSYHLMGVLSGHSEYICHAIFSKDGKYIVSGSFDKSIKVWNTTNGIIEKTLAGHTGAVNHVAVFIKGDNMLIASGSSDETVKIWNGKTGELLNTLEGHKNVVEYVSFSPEGEYLLSASSDIRIWDTNTGELIDILEGHKDLIHSVEFSKDSRRILSASGDGLIKLWDFPSVQDLIDSTKERFINRQLTQEERKKYYLE